MLAAIVVGSYLDRLAPRVQELLVRVIFARTLSELFDEDGNPRPMSEWPQGPMMQAVLQLLALKRLALKDVLDRCPALNQ